MIPPREKSPARAGRFLRKVHIGEIFRHANGQLYRVFRLDKKEKDTTVHYMDANEECYQRPLSEFNEEIQYQESPNWRQRFEQVDTLSRQDFVEKYGPIAPLTQAEVDDFTEIMEQNSLIAIAELMNAVSSTPDAVVKLRSFLNRARGAPKEPKEEIVVGDDQYERVYGIVAESKYALPQLLNIISENEETATRLLEWIEENTASPEKEYGSGDADADD